MIEAMVARSAFARLTPLIEPLVRFLDRIGSDARRPANLRRAVERHLAFGEVWANPLVALVAWPLFAIAYTVSAVKDGDWREAAVCLGLAAVVVPALLFAVAWRVRALLDSAARSVAIPARVSIEPTGLEGVLRATAHYAYAGVPVRGRMPSNVLHTWLSETITVLVDPQDPGRFFVRELHPDAPVSSGAARPAPRLGGIDAYVRAQPITSLTPLVDLFGALVPTGKRERDVTPIVVRARAPGHAPSRPTTRKILALDPSARLRARVSVGLFALPALIAVGEGVVSLAGGSVQPFLSALLALVLGAVAAMGALVAVAWRLRQLRRVLERAVVVQGRVVSLAPFVREDHEGRGKPDLSVTIEYPYAGNLLRLTRTLGPTVGALVDAEPVLLVDPQAPTTALIRDFYV